MRNYERKLKSKYHGNTLMEIKTKIGIKEKVVEKKTRPRQLIPSVISLAFSLVLVVLSITLLNSKKDNKKDDNNPMEGMPQSGIIADLEENTSKYLEVPIKTIFDVDHDVYVSIYYGIRKENEENEKHYIAIDYEKESGILIQTKIYELNEPMEEAVPLPPLFDHTLTDGDNGLLNIMPNLDIIIVRVVIDENVYEETLILDDYYNSLQEE